MDLKSEWLIFASSKVEMRGMNPSYEYRGQNFPSPSMIYMTLYILEGYWVENISTLFQQPGLTSI